MSVTQFLLLCFVLLLPNKVLGAIDQDECKKPWYISVDKNLRLSWMGDDRKARVVVEFSSESKSNPNEVCNLHYFVNASFDKKVVNFSQPCSNTFYKVVTTLNCNGEEVDRIVNTVWTPPLAPTSVRTLSVTDTSARITWIAPPGKISTYKVIWNNRSHDSKIIEVKNTVVELLDLLAYQNYDVQVSAKNEAHWSNLSLPFSFRTKIGIPFKPTNLKVLKVDSSSISLNWQEPSPKTGPVLKYEVRFSEVLVIETRYYTKTALVNFVKIEGLFPYTNYSVEVQAITDAGAGLWSEALTVQTAIRAPYVPVTTTTDQVTNTTIVISWKLEGLYRGPKLAYIVRWNESLSGVSETKQIRDLIEKTWYEIISLRPHTNYTVEVRARNEAGMGDWSDPLQVQTKTGIPTEPVNLTATSKTATSISLNWSQPEQPNGPLINYMIIWGATSQGRVRNEVSDSFFKAENLTPFTEYSFEVRARTDAGWGAPSKTLRVKTKIAAPSVPRNLTEDSVTNSTILIQWERPEFSNGPLLGYVIRWSKTLDNSTVDKEGNNSTFLNADGEITTDETNFTYYRIKNLVPYTNYSVEVCAQTEAGKGPWTDSIYLQTKVGLPSEPQNLLATKVMATRIQLLWKVPQFVNGPTLRYLIYWGLKDMEASLVKTSETSYNAVGLRPYTEYFFQVCAETDAGKGPTSQIFVRSNIATPGHPRDLSFMELTDSSLLLQWLAPEHPNGPHLQYIIRWNMHESNETVTAENINITSFRVKSLQSDTNYSFEISALNNAGRGPWSSKIFARTKCKVGSSTSRTPIIWGAVSGSLLLLLLVVVLVVLIRKKKPLMEYFRRNSSQPTMQPSSSEVTANRPLEMEVLHTYQQLIHKFVPLQLFDEHLNALMANGRLGFSKEFENIRRESPQLSSDVAKKDENLTKNRWVKVLPFDQTRVKLLPEGDEVISDYINASYIPGDNYLLEYIATQGPLPNTLNDFWDMIWQQSVSVIVMLTQCVERAKTSCEKYWPSSGEYCKFGTIQVHTLSESIQPSYVVRIFIAEKGPIQRHIVQMHFMNWPLAGCPRDPGDFLNFLKATRKQLSFITTGPMLVHCSAGVGRTGTFIAVDILSEKIKCSSSIDIPGTVLEMRRHRPFVVQTEEQYVFIHLCVQRLIMEKNLVLEDEYGTGIYSD